MKGKTFPCWLCASYSLLIRGLHSKAWVTGGRRGAGWIMIDWERVKELRAEIGAEDFGEVAVMFLEEADEAVGRLSQQLSAKAVEADLHFLKGAALNLGFDALSGLCQDGERRAAAGDTDIDLEAVRAAYFASKAAFENGMDQAFAA
jgi:HPt (histidine-containing phosphotransfer) domain-containing protein